MGENNSGKSTIIKLLADVYEAFAGSVRIAGIGLRTLDRGSYYSLLHNGISVLRLFFDCRNPWWRTWHWTPKPGRSCRA
ncbi:hypothetical protein JCM18909_2728 [Cutibacterium acnes JCM 18909]|nr:hypothetical protein JCM18909_2728 [Cutibacterium acnes JCM 18909]